MRRMPHRSRRTPRLPTVPPTHRSIFTHYPNRMDCTSCQPDRPRSETDHHSPQKNFCRKGRTPRFPRRMIDHLSPDHPTLAPPGIRQCLPLISRVRKELIPRPPFRQIRRRPRRSIPPHLHHKIRPFPRQRRRPRHTVLHPHPSHIPRRNQKPRRWPPMQKQIRHKWPINKNAHQHWQGHHQNRNRPRADFGH